MSTFRKTVTLALMVLALCFSPAYSESDGPLINLKSETQCFAKLDLPPGYDRFQLPGNTSNGPLKMHVEMDIREVREVDESKKSYTLEVFFYIHWRDERLKGQTERTNCKPLFPTHVTPEFWIPEGDIQYVF